MRALLADLQEKFPLLVELQDLSIRVSIPANPDISFVIDGDAVVALRPLVSRARTSPGIDQISCRVKFQNGRSHLAAHADRRSGIRAFEIVFNGPRPMNDPDVILGIDGQADGGSLHPMIRQRFRPVGIDFENRRLRRGCAGLRIECANEHDDSQAGTDGSEFHRSLRDFPSV